MLNTPNAAREALQVQHDVDHADLETKINQAEGEYESHLIDCQIELGQDCNDQERFLRNMALVGLASLLTRTLLTMARDAESFSPRERSYGAPALGRNLSNFEKLFAEFKNRFGFDLQEQQDLIGFVKTLNQVRNQIVHEGGLANPPKFLQDVHINIEDVQGVSYDRDFLNCRFSETYPEWIIGEGVLAEVNVSQQQLEDMIENAIRLVDFCAERIWTVEVEGRQ